MSKKAQSPAKHKNLLHIVESVLNLAVLPLSLQSTVHALFAETSPEEVIHLATEANPDIKVNPESMVELEIAADITGVEWVLAGLFLLLAVCRVLLGFRNRHKGKAAFWIAIGQAAVFAACSVLAIVLGFSTETVTLISVLYAAAMAAGRVESIIRRPNSRNVVMNLVSLIVLYFCSRTFLICGIVIFVLSMAKVIRFTFARFNYNMLRKIIRQTYAVEIIFGMVLLIFSFSFVLSLVEEPLAMYGDALWYCFAIVTTIGFGDFTATTLIGRIISVILGIYGIVVVALITSIIVNFYSEMKKEIPENAEPSELPAGEDPE